VVVECLSREPDQQISCMAPGVAVLSMVVGFLLYCFSLLVHFNLKFREASWEPLELPDHPNDIEDPLFRWVSKARFFLCRRCRDPKKILLDRPRGEFMRPWDQVEEPARTERLLANPWIFYRNNTADAIDALKLVLMSRASGFSFRGLCYDLTATIGQLMIAVLNGIGPRLIVGSSLATVQLSCVLSVQWGTAIYIFLACPSVDRVDALVMSLQLGTEGGMTFMLILGTLDLPLEARLHCQTIAFILSLIALALPIVEKLYDAVIVQLSKIFRKDEFTWAGCCFAMIGLILSLPSMIAVVFGVSELAAAGDLFSAADEFAGATEAAIDDAVTSGLGEALGVTSELFSNLAWFNNPLPKHHEAAVVIQRYRQQRQLLVQSNEHRAAAKLQAATRGKLTRNEYERAFRTMPESLQMLHAQGKSPLAARLSAMVWLDKQERKDAVKERLQRARLENSRRAKSFARPNGAGEFSRQALQMSRPPSKYTPGAPALHDNVVEGVGIVYTRARPSRQTSDEMRASMSRLQRRSVKKALPQQMPPRPPTVAGSGMAFADVVAAAQKAAFVTASATPISASAVRRSAEEETAAASAARLPNASSAAQLQRGPSLGARGWARMHGKQRVSFVSGDLRDPRDDGEGEPPPLGDDDARVLESRLPSRPPRRTPRPIVSSTFAAATVVGPMEAEQATPSTSVAGATVVGQAAEHAPPATHTRQDTVEQGGNQGQDSSTTPAYRGNLGV